MDPKEHNAAPKEGNFALRLDEFSTLVEEIQSELGTVIYGQEHVLRQMIACIFARGHCLMVGVPGLAKTMMVSCLAEITSLTFRRIQFTPDLMPSDITGTNIIEEVAGRREFRFMPGPLFAHIVLGDEINRTPPKTQAALLQAMHFLAKHGLNPTGQIYQGIQPNCVDHRVMAV